MNSLTKGSSFSLNKIAEGIIFSSLTLFLGKIFGLVNKIILAKLGVEYFGLFNLLISIFNTLLILCALGIPLGVTRYTSFYFARKKESKIKDIILTATVILLPTSLLITLLFYLLTPSIASLFKNLLIIPYLKIVLIGLPLAVLLQLIKATLSGFLKINYLFLLDNFETILNLIFFALFIYFGFGLAGVAVGYVLSLIGVLVAAFYFLSRLINFHPLKFVFFKKLFYFSWPVSLSEILRTLVNSGDLVFLGFFKGNIELGRYSVVITLGSLILIFPQLILNYFFPIITNLYGSKKKITSIYQKVTFWLIITSIPVFIIIILKGQQIAGFLFGQEYIFSWWTLFFYSLAKVIFSLVLWPGRQVLDMLGLTKQNLKLSFIRTLLLLVCWLLLIPKLGSVGASLGWLISWFIEAILFLVIIFRKTSLFTKK